MAVRKIGQLYKYISLWRGSLWNRQMIKVTINGETREYPKMTP